MRAKLWAAWSVTLVLASGWTPVAGPRAEELKFAWAIGALTGPENARQSIPVTREVTLKSGDELKIFFNQLTPSFAYVLLEDAKRNLEVLYPEKSGSGTASAATGGHYIPPDPDWFKLDEEPGVERIYLIASTTRLTALENLLSTYAAALTADKSGIRRQIYAELARFEKPASTAAWSERPVTMGGQVRGKKPPKPDVATGATEVTASGYFSRVLVINHQ